MQMREISRAVDKKLQGNNKLNNWKNEYNKASSMGVLILPINLQGIKIMTGQYR
jgi:hypothetical protein